MLIDKEWISNLVRLVSNSAYTIMAGLETSEEDRHFYPGTIIASFICWTLGITISMEVNHHTTSILSYGITWRESAWSTHTYLKRLRSACSQYKHESQGSSLSWWWILIDRQAEPIQKHGMRYAATKFPIANYLTRWMDGGRALQLKYEINV